MLALPDFSAYVKTALRNGDSGSVWQKMIEEMAHFYLDVIADDLTSQTQYLDIGRKMVEVYPCVNRVGAKPWVCVLLVLVFSICVFILFCAMGYNGKTVSF